MAKLANISVGYADNPVVQPHSTSNYKDGTDVARAQEYTIGRAYRNTSTNLIPTEETPVDSCTLIQSKPILGVINNNQCRTTTPVDKSYSYISGGPLSFTQGSGYNGTIFNNYVLKSKGQTKWVFECVFRPKSANGNLIAYGYNTGNNTLDGGCIQYTIAIKDWKLYCAFNWYNGEKSKWANEAHYIPSSLANLGSPDSYTSPFESTPSSLILNSNTWYHLCLTRIGATADYGNGTSTKTRCYLAQINNYPYNSTEYTKNYAQSNIWYAPRIFDGYLPDNFGTVTSDIGYAQVGWRDNNTKEFKGGDYAIVQPTNIGSSTIDLTGKVLLYGGTAYTQRVIYDVVTRSRELCASPYTGWSPSFSTIMPTQLSLGSGASLKTNTAYLWQNSLTIGLDGKII